MREKIRVKIHFVACLILFFFANYRYGFLNTLEFDIPKIPNIINLCAIVVSMLAALATTDLKIIRKKWLRILILCILSALIAFFSGEKSIFFSAVCIVCLSGIETEKIILTDMLCKAAVVLQAVILSLAGLLPNNAIEEAFLGLKYKIHSFGFGNPNTPALLVIFILIEFVYLFNIRLSNNENGIKHGNLKRILSVCFIGLLTMILTGNKTILIIIVLLAVFSMNEKILKFFGNPFTVILISAVTIVMALAFRGWGITSIADKLLHGRVSQAYAYFHLYDIKLFGEPLQMTGLEYFDSPITLDCFYPRMLLDFGLLYFILYMFASYILLSGSVCKKDAKSRNAVLVVIVIAFASIIENCYHVLWLNPSMLLLPGLIFGDFSLKDSWNSTKKWNKDFAAWVKKQKITFITVKYAKLIYEKIKQKNINKKGNE